MHVLLAPLAPRKLWDMVLDMTLPWVHDSQPLTRLCFMGPGGTRFQSLVRYELVVTGVTAANVSTLPFFPVLFDFTGVGF